MKRRIALALAALVLVFFLLPSVFFADDSPVITYKVDHSGTSAVVTIWAPDGRELPVGRSIWFHVGGSDWKLYSGPFELTESSTVTAKIDRGDGTETESVSQYIDFTGSIAPPLAPPAAPQIIADTETWVSDFVPVELVSSTDADPALSKAEKFEYRLGDTDQWHEYGGKLSVSSPVTLYARSVNADGTPSNEVSIDISNFDTTAPDVSSVSFQFGSSEPFIAESGAFTRYCRGDVSVAISGAADSQSGIDYFEYQPVGSAESLSASKWQRCSADVVPVINRDFCGYVYARAVDRVGNVSAPVCSEGMVVDKTAPAVKEASRSSTGASGSVLVRLTASDNFWLYSVSVNGNYIGVYDPSFTAYRNGDYVVEAADRAGNVTKTTIRISTIDTTAASLIRMFSGLNRDNFTPSSWVAAESAAAELQNLLTIEANDSSINAASEKLLTSLESLVVRGDGTASLQLIDRVMEYDPEKYTVSSWNNVLSAVNEIKELLEDPECTQADIDNLRHALETAVSEIVLRADFTNLDRLIARCEGLDSGAYDPALYSEVMNAVSEAKALPRDDSSQSQADEAYSSILSKLSALKQSEVEKKEPFSVSLLMIAIMALLVVIAATALFINSRRKKEKAAEKEFDEYDFDAEIGSRKVENSRGAGDIVFTDEDDD